MGNYHRKGVRVNYHYFVVMENRQFPYMADAEDFSVLFYGSMCVFSVIKNLVGLFKFQQPKNIAI